MRRCIWFLLIILLFVSTNSIAQDLPVKPDSLKLGPPKPLQSDSLQTVPLSLKLMRLNPTESLLPPFTPYQRITLSSLYDKNSRIPPIHWDGAASDFINSKSRTAVASMMPTPKFLLYSSATLGLVETPYFGKGNYYIVNGGANYAVTSALNVGMSGGYNSNFGTLPYWNMGMNASYMVSPDFSVDGRFTYLQTAQNMYNLNQSAVTIDLHGRYRLSDDWYLNAYGGTPVMQKNNQPASPMLPMMNTPYYGGTVEHWFKPTMGVEGGVIWMRDMFSGKMRPRPKLELIFRPGKR